MFARDGDIVFVEFKRPGKKPTVDQAAEHDEMRAAGLEVLWFDNKEDFVRFLKLRVPGWLA